MKIIPQAVAGFRAVRNLPRQIGLSLIRLYQHTLSPDHSWRRANFPVGYCRFYPTCSQYGYLSIEKKGLIRGLLQTGWRVLRCHPWSKGGVDWP